MEKEPKPFSPEVTEAVNKLLKLAEAEGLAVALWLENEESETASIGYKDADNVSVGLLAVMAIIYVNQALEAVDGNMVQAIIDGPPTPLTALLRERIDKATSTLHKAWGEALSKEHDAGD